MTIGEQVQRMASFAFEIPVDRQLTDEAGALVLDLIVKLNAEAARLKRLLPDAPEGTFWDFEEQRSDDHLSGTIKFRVVAKLKEIL